ncbi:MAG TPA: hypothetical protein VHL85_08370 [Burkholderiales bacterium]|jgi:hypothetical protein|nr:hypothetical protein [Burkholderiales bacterium]
MKSRLLPLAAACALFTLAGQGLAQTPSTQTYNPGPSGSPHCDSMTGAARQQCLNDEGAKTENGIGTPAPATAPSETATSASTGSPRCDSLAGADRAQCVRDEARKTDSSSGASSQRDSTR